MSKVNELTFQNDMIRQLVANERAWIFEHASTNCQSLRMTQSVF